MPPRAALEFCLLLPLCCGTDIGAVGARPCECARRIASDAFCSGAEVYAGGGKGPTGVEIGWSISLAEIIADQSR